MAPVHIRTSARLNLLDGRLRGPLAALLDAAAGVDAEEEGEEDHGHAQAAHQGDGVTVEEAGQEDGDGLPQSHDDGEDGGAELRDGVEDEELTAGRAHRQQHGVEGELGVARHEGQRFEKGALFQQRAHREETREEVDAEHHLHRRHLVLEQVVLPVRGEAVEDDVAAEDDDAREGGDGGRVFGRGAGQQEHADSHRDQDGREVLPILVALARHDLAHQHHGNHLRGLRQNLRRKHNSRRIMRDLTATRADVSITATKACSIFSMHPFQRKSRFDKMSSKKKPTEMYKLICRMHMTNKHYNGNVMIF